MAENTQQEPAKEEHVSIFHIGKGHGPMSTAAGVINHGDVAQGPRRARA